MSEAHAKSEQVSKSIEEILNLESKGEKKLEGAQADARKIEHAARERAIKLEKGWYEEAPNYRHELLERGRSGIKSESEAILKEGAKSAVKLREKRLSQGETGELLGYLVGMCAGKQQG